MTEAKFIFILIKKLLRYLSLFQFYFLVWLSIEEAKEKKSSHLDSTSDKQFNRVNDVWKLMKLLGFLWKFLKNHFQSDFKVECMLLTVSVKQPCNVQAIDEEIISIVSVVEK